MVTGAGTAKIYRWASETADPVLAASFAVTERTGDAFALSGTGVNTVLYASGNGSSKIYKLTTTNGIDFTHTTTATLPTASRARTSISPVTTGPNSDLWIDGPTLEIARINAAGTIQKDISTSTINQIYANAEYFTLGTQKFIVLGIAHDPSLVLTRNMQIYEVTDENNIVSRAATSLASTPNANTNASGDVAIKIAGGDVTFFHLATNNAIAAYTLSQSVLPVKISGFEARATNGKSVLRWTTSSESHNKDFEVQRSSDGQNFAGVGTVNSKALNGNSSETLAYSFTTNSVASGTHYYRIKQTDINGEFSYSEVKSVDLGLAANSFEVYPIRQVLY